MNTLVLGLGNVLLADEGVGVHAVRELNLRGLPKGVSALDIGISVLDALADIVEAKNIIIVEALKAGGPAGTVHRFDCQGCADIKRLASIHSYELSRALSIANRKIPPKIVVIGIEPHTINWSLELSPELEALLPQVIKVIESEIEKNNKEYVVV